MRIEENTLKYILQSIKGLRFGEIVLKVQDSRIVQIERLEKLKINKADSDFGEANKNIKSFTDQKTGREDV